MEHRWSKRIPLKLRVQIYYREIPVALGTTRNINLEGMFVKIPSAAFAMGTALDVEILAGHEGLKHHTLRGVVVHRSAHGFGVMFTTIEPDVLAKIYQLEQENEKLLASAGL